MSDGNLYAPGLVVNNPDILFPINNLNDYLFATKPAMSYGEFLQSRSFERPSLGNSTAPTAEKIELVLVSIEYYSQLIPKRSVSEGRRNVSHFTHLLR